MDFFERANLAPKPLFADYLWLAGKHPEYFSSPEDAKNLAEYVLDHPTHVFEDPDNPGQMLAIKQNGKHALAAVRMQPVARGYMVRRVYETTPGQVATKVQKWRSQLGDRNPFLGVVRPSEDEALRMRGPGPSHEQAFELAAESTIAPPSEEVNPSIETRGLPGQARIPTWQVVKNNLKAKTYSPKVQGAAHEVPNLLNRLLNAGGTAIDKLSQYGLPAVTRAAQEWAASRVAGRQLGDMWARSIFGHEDPKDAQAFSLWLYRQRFLAEKAKIGQTKQELDDLLGAYQQAEHTWQNLPQDASPEMREAAAQDVDNTRSKVLQWNKRIREVDQMRIPHMSDQDASLFEHSDAFKRMASKWTGLQNQMEAMRLAMLPEGRGPETWLQTPSGHFVPLTWRQTPEGAARPMYRDPATGQNVEVPVPPDGSSTGPLLTRGRGGSKTRSHRVSPGTTEGTATLYETDPVTLVKNWVHETYEPYKWHQLMASLQSHGLMLPAHQVAGRVGAMMTRGMAPYEDIGTGAQAGESVVRGSAYPGGPEHSAIPEGLTQDEALARAEAQVQPNTGKMDFRGTMLPAARVGKEWTNRILDTGRPSGPLVHQWNVPEDVKNTLENIRTLRPAQDILAKATNLGNQAVLPWSLRIPIVPLRHALRIASGLKTIPGTTKEQIAMQLAGPLGGYAKAAQDITKAMSSDEGPETYRLGLQMGAIRTSSFEGFELHDDPTREWKPQNWFNRLEDVVFGDPMNPPENLQKVLQPFWGLHARGQVAAMLAFKHFHEDDPRYQDPNTMAKGMADYAMQFGNYTRELQRPFVRWMAEHGAPFFGFQHRMMATEAARTLGISGLDLAHLPPHLRAGLAALTLANGVVGWGLYTAILNKITTGKMPFEDGGPGGKGGPKIGDWRVMVHGRPLDIHLTSVDPLISRGEWLTFGPLASALQAGGPDAMGEAARRAAIGAANLGLETFGPALKMPFTVATGLMSPKGPMEPYLTPSAEFQSYFAPPLNASQRLAEIPMAVVGEASPLTAELVRRAGETMGLQPQEFGYSGQNPGLENLRRLGTGLTGIYTSEPAPPQKAGKIGPAIYDAINERIHHLVTQWTPEKGLDPDLVAQTKQQILNALPESQRQAASRYFDWQFHAQRNSYVRRQAQ